MNSENDEMNERIDLETAEEVPTNKVVSRVRQSKDGDFIFLTGMRNDSYANIKKGLIIDEEMGKVATVNRLNDGSKQQVRNGLPRDPPWFICGSGPLEIAEIDAPDEISEWFVEEPVDAYEFLLESLTGSPNDGWEVSHVDLDGTISMNDPYEYGEFSFRFKFDSEGESDDE